jgi:hypothetical protein
MKIEMSFVIKKNGKMSNEVLEKVKSDIEKILEGHIENKDIDEYDVFIEF